MDRESWQKAKELFDQAMALPPGERSAFLELACEGNAKLREEVNDLVKSYDTDFLEEGAIAAGTELLGKSHFQAGKEIGRYHLKELIGTGGMGEVFRADDTELNRPVAFKALHEEVAEDKDRVRRFIQEARAASALNHPNILTIYEIGTHENSRFIVSEYVDGQTLREWLSDAHTVKECLEIGCQVAAALQAAHIAGIVHRDIKPENIMLRKDGLVKVLDFGLAKLTQVSDQRSDPDASTLARIHTSPGLVMGTAAYMSPEQARGVVVDARTDLWSLGVVLYEMLAGKQPFTGDTTSDIIASILKTDVEPIDQLQHDIPPDIAAACHKALTKDLSKRYQTADEMLLDLRKAAENTSSAVTKQSFRTTDRSGFASIRHTLSKEYIMNSVKNHKALTATILTLLILAIGVGTSMSWFGAADVEAPGGSGMNAVVSRLTTSGREELAAISPDGKYLAHVLVLPDGKRSLRVRQVETDNDRALIEGEFVLRSLLFSPDGNYIYYVKHGVGGKKNVLGRIPTLGGEELAITEKLEALIIGISPDGDHIVYYFQNPDADFTWELRVSSIRAMISGTDTPVTVTQKGAFRDLRPVRTPAFSPDGKRVSVPVEDWSIRKSKVAVFDLSGKPPLKINGEFSEIVSAVWLSNTDLLIAARRTDADLNMQMWQLGLDGSLKQLTSELSSYGRLSITADRSTVVALQSRTDSNVYLASPSGTAAIERSSFKQATREAGVQVGTSGMAWTSGNRLVSSYLGVDRQQLRIMDSDGSNNRALTNEKVRNPESPLVTPDGKYLLFNAVNDREEKYLWRMELATGAVTPLAYAGPFNWFPGFSVTPDSKYVIYSFVDPNWKNIPQDKLTGGLRKISIEGGEPTDVRVGDEKFPTPQISPDGKLLGLINIYGQIGVIPMNDLSAAPKYFDTSTAPPEMWQRCFRWSPDSRSIIYIAMPPGSVGGLILGTENLRRLPIDGSAPSNLTNFDDGQSIYSFAYSADGKKLAVARGLKTTDVVLAKNLR